MSTRIEDPSGEGPAWAAMVILLVVIVAVALIGYFVWYAPGHQQTVVVTPGPQGPQGPAGPQGQSGAPGGGAGPSGKSGQQTQPSQPSSPDRSAPGNQQAPNNP